MERFEGLIAATHTPFGQDGALNLAVIDRQAAHLLDRGISTVFIGGSTGECHSLTVDERRRLAARWLEVAATSGRLRVIVHVGSNCLADARALAAHAGGGGAVAIAAMAPSYFKPDSIEALLDCCADIAGAAPDTPFYFYDIPALTGVHLSMTELLRRAGDRVPSLRGIKWTNPDLAGYLECREIDGGRFDLLWGVDEMLLGALASGAAGAVGSTYNFAAPLYHRMRAALHRGEVDEARAEQTHAVRLVRALATRGYMASAKALMTMQGVDVGPPRLPIRPLTREALEDLRRELGALGDSVHGSLRWQA